MYEHGTSTLDGTIRSTPPAPRIHGALSLALLHAQRHAHGIASAAPTPARSRSRWSAEPTSAALTAVHAAPATAAAASSRRPSPPHARGRSHRAQPVEDPDPARSPAAWLARTEPRSCDGADVMGATTLRRPRLHLPCELSVVATARTQMLCGEGAASGTAGGAHGFESLPAPW